MTWYVWLYVACFAAVGIYSAYDDRRTGLSGAYVAVSDRDRAIEGVGILVGIAFALPALIFAAMVVLRAW
jgi:hypothetical protein